jgi:hypothetical protein
MAKPVGYLHMRRLAAVESLCRYAQTAVRLKMGDSAKLARADDDLVAAIAALASMREELALSDPIGMDNQAAMMAALGEVAAANYMRAAKR